MKCTVREPLRKVHEAILEVLAKFTILDLAETSGPESPIVQLSVAPVSLHPERTALHQGL